MIHLEDTPNHAGVYVTGDLNDFDDLYEALHEIVGEEGEYVHYDAVRTRVLGLWYDLRHAMMGNRGTRFVPNGMDREKRLRQSIACSESNVYLQCGILWPELLFISFALNDFIGIREHQKKPPLWDPVTATVRKFQAAVQTCLSETLPESKFSRCKRYLRAGRGNSYSRYLTQYIDELNLNFLHMDADERFNSISVMVKRVNEKNARYAELHAEFLDAARHYGVDVEELQYKGDYPEMIDW
ncbi:DUF6904 family protein [Sporosarcina koreensis]|uniref:DUF6904 family protein n=1 Tax=Sporosarcina koreensis TaxID=334735 RepID=UPI00058F30FC|nr:hypothetical protein [Sporosarcina koreensis]